jgi:hypothetical protein
LAIDLLTLLTLDTCSRFKWLLTLLKQLHDLSFRVISFEPNMVMGKINGYYQFFEIVFKKDNEWNYLDVRSTSQ